MAGLPFDSATRACQDALSPDLQLHTCRKPTGTRAWPVYRRGEVSRAEVNNLIAEEKNSDVRRGRVELSPAQLRAMAKKRKTMRKNQRKSRKANR